MSTAYIFDVDGTLTPSRQSMDSQFKEWFLLFQNRLPVYLVTGSDFPKTLEQLGQEVVDRAQYIFNCCGNEVRRTEILYKSSWKPSDSLLEELQLVLNETAFPIKTGNHIEIRTGMLNFSIVGRNADLSQRKEFFEYDQKTQTRESISQYLQARYPECGFSIAGETGIDIYERDHHKGQIKKWIKEDRIIFFGDRTEPGGNDYEIARLSDNVHQVEDWKETFAILRSLYDTV